jgi:RNA polymerase sigma-70 factor (ECF subfamily)
LSYVCNISEASVLNKEVGRRMAGRGGRHLADIGKESRLPADLDGWVLATASDAVAFAASLLRDRGEAEDVVQDCYCRLLRKAAEYDLLRDGRKLLFAAITNACINRNTRAHVRLSLDAAGNDGVGLHEILPDHAATEPPRAAIHRELEAAVDEALGRLPMPQKAALELKSLGHSLQEIGDALGVNPGHAAVLIHRARQAMSKLLAPHLEGQPH